MLDCSYLCLGRGCRHKARAHPAQTRQFIIQIMIHISLQPSPALRLTTALLLPVWDGIEAQQPLTKASLSSSRGRPPLSQKFSNCVQHLLAALLHKIKPVANNTKTSLIENWRTTLLQVRARKLTEHSGPPREPLSCYSIEAHRLSIRRHFVPILASYMARTTNTR